MPPTPEDFGEDRYCYLDGTRYKVGIVRTIRPHKERDETNGQFERRMDALAKKLRDWGCTTIALAFERREGSIVQCVIEAAYPPKVDPVADDDRPAGGRPLSLVRGGKRAA